MSIVIPEHHHAATRERSTGGPVETLSLGRELLLLAIAGVVYFGGRILVEGSTSVSVRNAERLLELERFVGIDIEVSVQALALRHDWLRLLGNLSYVWLHWPLLLMILFVLFRRDVSHYVRLRSSLFASGAVGLLLFWGFPMAPPRFMDGFVGTVSDDARRHYLDYPMDWANRYAAFPSFHVGWTLIACLALAGSLRSRSLRVLSLVPAGLVGFSVISTGNHYLIDAVAGALIALAAYRWFDR